MNTARVYLEHPDLPGQGIWVHPKAVTTHRASGWEPADPPAPPKPADKPTPTPRRRRAARNDQGDER